MAAFVLATTREQHPEQDFPFQDAVMIRRILFRGAAMAAFVYLLDLEEFRIMDADGCP